jgi:type IV pilus assembly protein PilM
VLAVDVGSHSVKLVAARHDATGVRVEAAARGEVPAGAVHGHVVRDRTAVADVVRRLAGATRRQARRVVTALPGAAVMMRRMVVRAQPGASLDALVVREAAPLVPDAIEHAVLDYQVLGSTGPDAPLRILVVAARRDLVQSYTATLRAAGLETCAVDVDVFALDRLRRAARDGAPDEAPVGMVHVGARRADVIVVRSDGPAFVGDVPAVGPGLDPASLAREIHRALDLFSPDGPVRLGGLVLSGGAAGAPGLATALGERLGCPVTLAEPFGSVALGPRVERASLDRTAAAFAVAMGLALGRPRAG